MARSYKKKAAGGSTTSSSEKLDKRQWHKKLRTIELQKLNIHNEPEEQIMPVINEVSDPWIMSKDGKGIYFTEAIIRKEIDGYINSLKNGVDHGSANYSIDVKRYFFDCFKTNKIKSIISITDKQREKLIVYILKAWKKK
jgi:hypothetical protein